MNVFQIIGKLFTSNSPKWILDVDEKITTPVLIQKFLSLYPQSKPAARVLTKYAYDLNLRMYLGCAWSMLFFNGKKMTKAPFIKYPKKSKKTEKYQYIYDKLKKQFSLSEKDLQDVKVFVDADIEAKKTSWFCYYNAPKTMWLENNINHKLMKEYGGRDSKGVKTLFDF